MTNELKKKLEKITQAKSTELHKLRFKISQENYASEVQEIRDFLKKEKSFTLLKLEVINFDFVNLSLRWRGTGYGKYHIY